MLAKLLSLAILVSCSSLKVPVNENNVVNLKKKIWTKNVDQPYSSGSQPLSFTSPAIDSDMVYVPSITGHFYAYDLLTGRTKWSFKEDGALSGRPVVYKEAVIYSSMMGRIYSRDRLRGDLVWAIDLGAPMESTPIVAGDVLLFHLRNHAITALDARTGKVLWSYRRTIANATTLQRVSRPVVHEQKIFVGAADGNVLCLSLDDGSLIWESKLTTALKFIDVDVEVYVEDGKVYAGSAADQLQVLNIEDGTSLQTIPLNVSFGAIKNNDRLYFGTFTGEVAVVYHNEVVNKVKLSKSGIGSMEWWRGKLLAVTMDGNAFLMEPTTLKIIDRFSFGSAHSSFYGDIAVYQDYMALMSTSSRIYVFN